MQKVKKCLSQAPILAYYDPELPLVLAASASAYGLGAIGVGIGGARGAMAPPKILVKYDVIKAAQSALAHKTT